MENKHYPVSVEQLAAFLEGNLPDEEMKRMGEVISQNAVMRALVDSIDSIEDANEMADDIHPDYSVEDIAIPDLSDIDGAGLSGAGPLAADDDAILRENVESFLEEERAFAPIVDLGDSNGEESDSIIRETIKSIHETMSTKKIYGYEPNYELDKFDPLIFQGYQPTCAIRSQQIVLRDYGIMFSQQQLKEYAQRNGWFPPDSEDGGTPKQYVGNLLDACGIQTTRTEGATIYDIIAELRAGHRVIVGVDADELWIKNEPSLLLRLFGEMGNRINDAYRDLLGIQGANHALVVAGVTVNPSDPSDLHVTLIDPGTGDVCIEYSWKDFEQAWNDGNHTMISTNEPAPFQYNYETHQMEPSGFDTSYMPANAVTPAALDNTFSLSEEYYQKYEDYQSPYCEEEPLPFEGADGHDGAYEDDDDVVFVGDHSEMVSSEMTETESFGEEVSESVSVVHPEEEEPVDQESFGHDNPAGDDSETDDVDITGNE